MDVICLEQNALYVLIDAVLTSIENVSLSDQPPWLTPLEAMKLLRIKSPTTLQKLREERKIRASQPSIGIILYDRQSLLDYLEDFAYETFDMP